MKITTSRLYVSVSVIKMSSQNHIILLDFCVKSFIVGAQIICSGQKHPMFFFVRPVTSPFDYQILISSFLECTLVSFVGGVILTNYI